MHNDAQEAKGNHQANADGGQENHGDHADDSTGGVGDLAGNDEQVGLSHIDEKAQHQADAHHQWQAPAPGQGAADMGPHRGDRQINAQEEDGQAKDDEKSTDQKMDELTAGQGCHRKM